MTATTEDRAAAEAQRIALRMAADGIAFSHLAVAGWLRGKPLELSPAEVWRALMEMVPDRLARDPKSGYFHAPPSEP